MLKLLLFIVLFVWGAILWCAWREPIIEKQEKEEGIEYQIRG